VRQPPTDQFLGRTGPHPSKTLLATAGCLSTRIEIVSPEDLKKSRVAALDCEGGLLGPR